MLFNVIACIGLVFLVIGICRVNKISKLVPKLKANQCTVAIHTITLLSETVLSAIYNLFYMLGLNYILPGILCNLTIIGHKTLMLYMIVKFGKQSLISVKYKPNGAITIVVSKSNQVIFERNLTSTR